MSEPTGKVSRVYKDLELYVDDDIAKLNNPLPPTTTQQPSQAWLEFLYRVRPPLDIANEFVCVHNKFYWTPCPKCRRSPEGAKYWKAKLLPKLAELLKGVK